MSALDALDLLDVQSLLSDEERLVRDTVRRFVDDRILPIIRECFEEHRFPQELIPEIASLGLLGDTLEGYECAGLSSVCSGLAYQELEREGFIETRRGEGSFVTRQPGRIDDERRRLADAACQQFSEQILDLGLTSSQLQVLLERIDKEVKAR